MSDAIVPVYLPPLTYLTCPYPQKPLDLYFAVQWLRDAPKQVLLQTQRQCRMQPAQDIPEERDTLWEQRLTYLGEISGQWMQHPTLGLLPPIMATSIAARHENTREVSAQREFQIALIDALEKFPLFASLSQQQYDPFAVWYGLVQQKERRPGYAALERLQAERQITELVLRDGKVGAQTAALQIVEATEINFRAQELSPFPVE